jgi:hypothetical protein
MPSTGYFVSSVRTMSAISVCTSGLDGESQSGERAPDRPTIANSGRCRATIGSLNTGSQAWTRIPAPFSRSTIRPNASSGPAGASACA